jgi:hypothetical protein
MNHRIRRAEPTVTVCVRIGLEGDVRRRRLETELNWTTRRIVEEALKALEAQALPGGTP